MSERETLAPCPWCGGRPTITPAQVDADLEQIGCENERCPVGPGVGYLPLAEAIAAWNTRAHLAPAPQSAPEPVREAAQALLDSLAQEREWRDDPAVSPTHYGLARQQTDDDARALRAVLRSSQPDEPGHDR